MSDLEEKQRELKDFLDTWGLEKYFDAMVREDVDLATLRELDDADFRDLGLSIGHRKTLRRALSDDVAQPTPTADENQRRQVTVLFCDLVGSTQLANRYDIEETSEILERYRQFVSDVVISHGGLTLGTQGDGFVACFGYPKAAENDAKRAVMAALDISRGVRGIEFEDGLELHTRIGLATGRVLVRGQVTDSGALVGDILNLASRLQDKAPVDTVVIGENTQKLIRKNSELERLGEFELKGFEGTIPVWRVDTVYDAEDRLVGDSEQSSHPLLGREREKAQIEALWNKAKAGAGQALFLTGEAGIGKSQLLDFAREVARADDAVTIRYFASQGYENSALYPIRSELIRRSGLRDLPVGKSVSSALADFLGTDDPVTLRLISDLVSVDLGADIPMLDMTATEQKQATFKHLVQMLHEQAASGPLLVLFEDAHWADPTTQELLKAIVSQSMADQPILLVVTHRPELQFGLDQLPHVSQLELRRLDEAESREIVQGILGAQGCPPEILRMIIEAADGNPLFLEELSRSVAEQRETASNSYSSVKIPVTLEDSLRARLDRLSDGKTLVQTASVFGTRFQTPTLSKVLSLEEAQCSAKLAEPIEAQILTPIKKGSLRDMMFRHVLVQQAAYEGITRKQRQKLHSQFAVLLLELQPGIAETEPETLARHYAGAGDYTQAINYLIAAGKTATARAAQIEATNHYFSALDHLTHLPEGRARDELEVLLRALLGGALMATRGFAAPEVYDAFARARDLCMTLGDSPMYCSCLYGLFTVAASRSDKAEALALADEMLATFGEFPVPSWAIAAHFSVGVARFFEGRFDEAEHHFDKAIDLYDPEQHALLVEQFGDNLTEFSMCYRHWLHMLRGELAQSAALLARAESMANDLNNKNAQTRSVAFRMGRMMELGAADRVAEVAPGLIELSTVQGYPYWACAGQIGLGWAMSSAGQEQGIAPITGSLDFFDMIGQRNPQTYWRSYLISAHTRLGQRDAALEAADLALEMSRNGLDSAFEPSILLNRGAAELLEPAQPEKAEASFRAALASAQDRGAHLHSFLSALALAELLCSQDRAAEEGGVLKQTMSLIADTGELAAMDHARTLLDQL